MSAYPVLEVLEYSCPGGDHLQSKHVRIGGGCVGHHLDDPYCYCDAPHLLVECEPCGEEHQIGVY